MNDNDWIKQLQSMMERHEEPVPDDLWQDIEAQLPDKQASKHMMPAWRRYATAAAVALAVIGTGYLLWPDGNDSTIEKPTTTMVQGNDEPQPATESFAQNNDTRPDVAIPTAAPRSAKAVTAKTMPNAINSTGDQIVQAISSPIEIKEVQEINDKEPNSQPTDQVQPPSTGHNETHVNLNTGHIVKPSRQRQPITIGLYASNGFKPDLFNRRRNELVANPFTYSLDSTDYGSRQILKGGPSQELFSVKHHAPYSLGVSIRMPLTDRIAVTSGLVYTRVKSDFTLGYHGHYDYEEQILHYLGVPLGATYSLWHYKRLNVYAIGGMQADFNFKAALKKSTQINVEKMQKDRVQFSALAGPGLQFGISKNIGIYLEPTLRYYFNNGSTIENYFKDKPWNINLNVGLRFTIQ